MQAAIDEFWELYEDHPAPAVVAASEYNDVVIDLCMLDGILDLFWDKLRHRAPVRFYMVKCLVEMRGYKQEFTGSEALSLAEFLGERAEFIDNLMAHQADTQRQAVQRELYAAITWLRRAAGGTIRFDAIEDFQEAISLFELERVLLPLPDAAELA